MLQAAVVADEDELARRAQAGDRESLESLAGRFLAPLRAFMARLIGPAEAEDAAQDVLLNVARAIGTYAPSRRFSTWVFGIAVNRARDIRRRRPPPREALPEASSNLPPMTRREDRERLDAAIARLPEDLSEPLLLAYQQGLSMAETAEALDLSLSAAKMRIHRAIRQLRALMREEAP